MVDLKDFIFPFVVPKVLFFRSVILVTFLAYLLLIWQDRKYLPSKNAVFLATTAFIFIAFLSSVLGVDWHNSFWGNFERMEGYLTLLCLYLYMVLLAIFFKEKKDWLWFLNGFLIVGILVIFVGLLQRLAPADDPFLSIGGSGRVYGTLGNFIYFGHFSLFVIWLSALLYQWSDFKHKIWVYLPAGLFGLYGMFLAGSRGPFVGLFISLIFFGVGLVVISKNRKIKIGGAIVGVLMAVILGLAVFTNTSLFNGIPAIKGLREIATFEGTANTRLMAWKIAWQGFLDRPVLGWGWFNYYPVFNLYYNPQFLEHGWGETWFDHAHNQYFDLLATTGALGLISYLLIFILIFYYLYRLAKKDSLNKYLALIFGALIISHLVNNFFVFEDASSYMLNFTMLAFVVYLWTCDSSKNVLNDKTKQAVQQNNEIGRKIYEKTALILVWPIFLVSVYLLYYGNYKAYQANTGALKAVLAFYEDPIKTGSLLKEMANFNSPHQRDIANSFGEEINKITPVVETSPQYSEYLKLLQIGVDILEPNLAKTNLDARHMLVLSQLYKYQYFGGDETVLDKMDKLFVDLVKISPNRQQVYYYWSEYFLLKGDYDNAIAKVQKTLADDDKLWNGYWMLAKIEGSRGNWAKSKEYLDKALERHMGISSENQFFVDTINQQSKNILSTSSIQIN